MRSRRCGTRGAGRRWWGPWVETEIDAIGSHEFAFLVDLKRPQGISVQAGPERRGPMDRHLVDYGGREGSGVQMVLEDIDGDRDIVTARKIGLFLFENLVNGPRTASKQVSFLLTSCGRAS